MQISGLTLDQFTQCTDFISDLRYGGNVMIHIGAHNTIHGHRAGPTCTARLTVRDSHGPGSRTSWNGRRHGPWACWHAYRDVLTEVFTRYPDAVVVAGRHWRVTYRGAQGFLDTYLETARVNVGSQANPVTMPELCQCADQHVYFSTALIEPNPVVINHYTDADDVSEAVVRASQQMALSQQLLDEKPLDPYVFGPEYRHGWPS